MRYAYDGRDNRTSTFYPLGQRTDERYDANGRLTETHLFLGGVPAVSRRAYDAYGNTVAEIDAEGRAKSRLYGGFGRLLEEIDEDGVPVGRAAHQGPDVDGTTALVGEASEGLVVGDLVTAVVTGTEGVDLLAEPTAPPDRR